jgi:hypothetical protein
MNSTAWELYFDKTPVADFGALLDRYEAKEFASVTRSTLPLLSFVKHGWPMFQPVLREFGFNGGGLHFEFRVDPARGRGKASHTDLMVENASAAVAIEAKWTEPEYASVVEWLGTAATPNKRLVLQAWAEMMQPFANRQLSAGDFSEVAYQMVHRAASACAVARRVGISKARLVYLVFTPTPSKEDHLPRYRAKLAQMHTLLGSPPSFAFNLVCVEMQPVALDSKGVDAVRTAIQVGKMFEFKKVTVEEISGA